MAGHKVVFHVLAELQSVHHGHHHIRHDEVGHLLARRLQSLLTVGSLVEGIAVLQNGAQIDAYVVVVVDDEHRIGFLSVVVGGGLGHRTLDGSSAVLQSLGGSIVRSAVGLPVFVNLHIENLIHHSGQLFGVSLHDVEHLGGFLAGILHVAGGRQLGQRTLDQRQRGAQLVAGLGVEVELLTGHLVALAADTGFLPHI